MTCFPRDMQRRCRRPAVAATLALLAVAAHGAAGAAWAQTPRRITEVPPYPGAIADGDIEAEGPGQEARFTVEAHIGAVLRFYIQRLRGTAGAAYEFESLFVMRAGAVTPVGYELEFHEFKDLWCGADGCGVPEALSGPPDLLAKDDDRRWAERAAAVAARPPSERDLGVPLYPGAEFDAQNTAGMSSDEEAYYIYRSTDPVEKVLAFYQQRTGKKAEPLDDGYMIVLRGEAPFPDLGVTIQTNTMFPPPAKTVITIRKSPQ